MNCVGQYPVSCTQTWRSPSWIGGETLSKALQSKGKNIFGILPFFLDKVCVYGWCHQKMGIFGVFFFLKCKTFSGNHIRNLPGTVVPIHRN